LTIAHLWFSGSNDRAQQTASTTEEKKSDADETTITFERGNDTSLGWRIEISSNLKQKLTTSSYKTEVDFYNLLVSQFLSGLNTKYSTLIKGLTAGSIKKNENSDKTTIGFTLLFNTKVNNSTERAAILETVRSTFTTIQSTIFSTATKKASAAKSAVNTESKKTVSTKTVSSTKTVNSGSKVVVKKVSGSGKRPCSI
jgi:hypothetical protein